MEVPDAVGAVVGRGLPPGSRPRPARRRWWAGSTAARTRRTRNTGPGKRPGHLLDAVELGVVVRVGGLLPGLGALEGDTASSRICRSRSRPIRTGTPWHAGQVGGELAQGPAGEGLAELRRAGGGRRDDRRESSSLIRRGRPPAHRGSSAARPFSLNRWITSRTVSSSAAPAGRSPGPGSPPPRPSASSPAGTGPTRASPPHDLLQPLPLLVRQPAHTDRLSHHASRAPDPSSRIECEAPSATPPQPRQTRRTFLVSALDDLRERRCLPGAAVRREHRGGSGGGLAGEDAAAAASRPALAAELRRVLDQVLTPALTPAELARIGKIIMT